MDNQVREADVLEMTTGINKTNVSPEKLKDVKVHWTIAKPLSQQASENFNRILAHAQIRAYRNFPENT